MIGRAVRESARIFGPMTDAEILFLARSVQPKMRILELGALYGKTTKVFAHAAPETHVCVVDSFIGQPHDRSHPDTNRAAFFGNLSTEIATGQVQVYDMTTRQFAAGPGLGYHDFFDLVWIDADHTYSEVCHDLALAAAVAKPGALICGHDAHWSGVARALEPFGGVERLAVAPLPLNTSSENKIWQFRKAR